MDDTLKPHFDEWLRRILERVFTTELERQAHTDLEFVFLPGAPDSHDAWRALNEC